MTETRVLILAMRIIRTAIAQDDEQIEKDLRDHLAREFKDTDVSEYVDGITEGLMQIVERHSRLRLALNDIAALNRWLTSADELRLP